MNTLSRWFAPPQYLLMPAAGIEVSDAFVRAIMLIGTPGNLRVAWWAEEPLPAGAVVGGAVHDAGAVARALTKIRVAHPFRFAHFSLPEQRAFLCEMGAPAASVAETRRAVGLHLEEEVPLRAEEALFDLAPLARGKWRVAAVPRATVEALGALSAEVSIAPLSFDVEPCAVVRAVVGVRNQHTLLIANFSEDDTGLYLVVSGMVRFALTVSLVVETPEHAAAVAAEARRVLGFWETHTERAMHGGAEAIVACGRGADDPAFLSALSHELHVPVEKASVWENACSAERSVPPISERDSLRFAAAIGLALRSFSYV